MSQPDPYRDTEEPDYQPVGDPASTPPPRPGQRVIVSNPRTRPLVTFSILGLTAFVFVLQLASQSLYGVDLPALYGSKVNDLIEAGQYWRFLTPMLLHGSILHVGFNMYALYILGPGLERFYGHWRFLALYLVSGFAGNVFSMIFTPNPSLGASTAIFGLLAAQAIFLYQNRRVFGPMSQRGLINIVLVAALNFVLGLSPGIDNWGHLGGFIGGGMFAYLCGPILEVRPGFGGYEVQDLRRENAGLLALFIVGVFFTFLAAMTLYMRA